MSVPSHPTSLSSTTQQKKKKNNKRGSISKYKQKKPNHIGKRAINLCVGKNNRNI